MQYLAGVRPDASGQPNPNPPGINRDAWDPNQLQKFDTANQPMLEFQRSNNLFRLVELAGIKKSL
jgi:hypothetical protein